MLEVILIPVAILACTVVVYFAIDPAFGQYLTKLEDKTRTMQKISILITSSNLVNFFSGSDASRVVETLLTRTQHDQESLEDVLMQLGGKASGEIETLYLAVKKGYEPLEHLAKVKVASTFLRIVILFYGISVSFSEFLLIYLRYATSSSVFSTVNGFIFGGTMLSSAIVAFIIAYILNTSRKIDGNYARLQSETLSYA